MDALKAIKRFVWNVLKNNLSVINFEKEPDFKIRFFFKILRRIFTSYNIFDVYLRPKPYKMVQSKTELFETGLTAKANLFKALVHLARLRILQFLAETKTCITGDISDELPLVRTTVNQHLKVLKDVGLIQGEIESSRIKYCINKENWKEAQQLFKQFPGI